MPTHEVDEIAESDYVARWHKRIGPCPDWGDVARPPVRIGAVMVELIDRDTAGSYPTPESNVLVQIEAGDSLWSLPQNTLCPIEFRNEISHRIASQTH